MEQEQIIELPLEVVMQMSSLLEDLLENEVETKTNFKHMYLDESGKEVKNPTEKQIVKNNLRKVFNFQKTIFESKLETTITEKGIKYARLKYFLDSNIKKLEVEKSKESIDTKEEQ